MKYLVAMLILIGGCATSKPEYPSISICPTCTNNDCYRIDNERRTFYTCKVMGSDCKCVGCGCCCNN